MTLLKNIYRYIEEQYPEFVSVRVPEVPIITEDIGRHAYVCVYV